jgi:radical SAM superfamily enzyme YgiQ (UPF0313 family)
MASRRVVLLAQLPIPPLGPEPIRGNVPLAAAYLKLFAEKRGLASDYDIQILPAPLASSLGDRALAAALAERRPWLVGFTCYLWNIERTLWIARELKRLRPEVRVVLGGPEITADNRWVLEHDAYDFAVVGEGEQTFTSLLLALLDDPVPPCPIAGLYVAPESGPRFRLDRQPAFRTPMSDLNQLGSPYLAGILDAADEQMLLLETTRGCVFKCKFCYYPKSYDRQYYLSADAIRANLRHAQERGAKEVFLLDPTLNQRKDFHDFLRLLIEGNPDRRFQYFGELRGEGVTAETARLLREAHFTEVEVGLQSIDPAAMTLMERKNNLRSFERGVRAMLDQGIKVRVDLIVGLPGDTVESVRRGLRYLHDGGLYSELQVFNLAILPGTAFRNEAAELGLTFQPRPPYYVLNTPTLRREDLFGLMQEAQALFEIEFDACPPPLLDLPETDGVRRLWRIDLDDAAPPSPPPVDRRALAFTLWFRARDFRRVQEKAANCIRSVLADNPFTTLQVVVEPALAEPIEERLPPSALSRLLAACQETPTYLDKFYALQPGGLNGAKRLVVLLPRQLRCRVSPDWLDSCSDFAVVVWRGPVEQAREEEMEPHEFAWTT